MYLVKTYLSYSDIHGIGVFAAEDIPQGAVVWQLVEGLDRSFTPEQVADFPEAGQDFIRRHAYPFQGRLWLCSDHGLFVNHNDNPNTASQGDRTDIAVRAIGKDEEITFDYRQFDQDAVEKLMAQAPVAKA